MLAVLAELFVKSTLRYCIVAFVTFLLNPGPTTACRKSMSHSQPLFVAGRHINTLLRTHVAYTRNYVAYSRMVIFLLLANVRELKQTKH